MGLKIRPWLGIQFKEPLFIIRLAFSLVCVPIKAQLEAGRRSSSALRAKRCSEEEGQPQNKMSLALEEALATAMRSASAGVVHREWVFSSTEKNDFILYLLFACICAARLHCAATRTANMEILLIAALFAIGFCSLKPLSRSQNSGD